MTDQPYQPYQQTWQQPTPVSPYRPADFGTRVVAYLIDVAILMVLMLALMLLVIVLVQISEPLALILGMLGGIALTAYFMWEYLYRQGVTGQTIGKQYRGIALVRLSDYQPVGGGMSFARYLIASAISQVTCGIYGIVDLVWPAFDADRQRLTDKILKYNVVQLDQSRPVGLKSYNPFTPLADETPPVFTSR